MEWAKFVHWIELARELPVPRTPLVVDPLLYRHTRLIHYANALYRTGGLDGACAFSQLAP